MNKPAMIAYNNDCEARGKEHHFVHPVRFEWIGVVEDGCIDIWPHCDRCGMLRKVWLRMADCTIVSTPSSSS